MLVWFTCPLAFFSRRIFDSENSMGRQHSQAIQPKGKIWVCYPRGEYSLSPEKYLPPSSTATFLIPPNWTFCWDFIGLSETFAPGLSHVTNGKSPSKLWLAQCPFPKVILISLVSNVLSCLLSDLSGLSLSVFFPTVTVSGEQQWISWWCVDRPDQMNGYHPWLLQDIDWLRFLLYTKIFCLYKHMAGCVR